MQSQTRSIRAKRARQCANEGVLKGVEKERNACCAKRRRTVAEDDAVAIQAARTIQKWWPAVKTANLNTCPITLCTPSATTRFTLVQPPSGSKHGARYAFCACALARYFVAAATTECPLTRRKLNALELLRLHNKVQHAVKTKVMDEKEFGKLGFAPTLYHAQTAPSATDAQREREWTMDAMRDDAMNLFNSAIRIAQDSALSMEARSQIIRQVLAVEYAQQITDAAMQSLEAAARIVATHRRMFTEYRLRAEHSSVEDLRTAIMWHEQRVYEAARDACLQQQSAGVWPFSQPTIALETTLSESEEQALRDDAHRAYGHLFQVVDYPGNQETIGCTAIRDFVATGCVTVLNMIVRAYVQAYAVYAVL